MTIRFLGHAGFQIKIGNSTIIIDPFITGSPNEGNIILDSIEADFVLLTHAHSDHIADAEYIAKNNDALIISNFEICNHFSRRSCRVHSMNHGGKVKFDELSFKFVNAIHSSSFMDGSYGGNPGGFVIWDQDACIYHAGDTALTRDMELIPMLCPKLRIGILPIGDNFTMGFEEAALAAKFIQCHEIIACHYNTFDVIRLNERAAKAHFEKNNLKLHLLEFNETLEV